MNNCETKDKLIQEGIELAKQKGVIQVIYREGEALKEFHPKNLDLQGAIDSPSRFIEKRKTEFNPLKSNTIVNRDKRTILTTINEDSEAGNITIKGELMLSEQFTELGINSGKQYTPVQLSNKLKLMRSFFASFQDHANIVSTLKNLKATINKKIEDLNDNKGNVSKLFEQTVQSNMPDSFDVNLTLIKGEPKHTFPLVVNLEVHNSDIICTLESIEAQEIIEKIIDTRIDEEIEKIKDYTTIIEA